MSDTEHGGWRGWLRSWGITASAIGAVIAIIAYVYATGTNLGAMHRQLEVNNLRLESLEQRGSGPVQATVERVNSLQSQAERVVRELLDMQRRMGDLASKVDSNAVILKRLNDDYAAEHAHRPTEAPRDR